MSAGKEEEVENSQSGEAKGVELPEVEETVKEDLAAIEGRELEERRANIQQWVRTVNQYGAH